MTRTSHTITPEQVKLLIREGEGLIVEFKERYTQRIDEDIVAFANTRGGTLLLGVRDGGVIVGERLTNDLKAKINSLTRNCKPGEPDGFFRAIFHRSPEFALKEVITGSEAPEKKIGAKTTRKTTPETTRKTTRKTTPETTRKIIALIRKNPEITRQELAIELGITEDGVKYHLKEMANKGLLRRIGPGKGGHWEVPSEQALKE